MDGKKRMMFCLFGDLEVVEMMWEGVEGEELLEFIVEKKDFLRVIKFSRLMVL